MELSNKTEKTQISQTMPNSVDTVFLGKKFMIFSEYAVKDPESYAKIAISNNCHVIGGAMECNRISSSLYDPQGNSLGIRSKIHLTPKELQSGRKEGEKIYPFELNINGKSVAILPILCYEALFPEDYMGSDFKVDLVVHHVGFPMYNKWQDEDWMSIQKVLSLQFKCDVIVVCGDSGEKGINSTGVIHYNFGRPYRDLLSQKRE